MYITLLSNCTLSSVNNHVAPLYETLATQHTDMGSVSSVNVHVSVPVHTLGEGGITSVTFVRSFSSVCSIMSYQFSFLDKTLFTTNHFTFLLSLLHVFMHSSYMPVHRIFTFKLFATLMAL